MDLNSHVHLATLTPDQKEQLHLHQAYWSYYNGNHKRWLLPKILPSGHTVDDNIKVNLSKRVVHKGNYFLFGKGINWQLDEGLETQETILSEIWGNQETQNSFLSEVGINGAVTGTFYIQIVAKDTGISLKNLDPTWIFPIADPNNTEEVFAYDMRYPLDGEIYRIYHNRISPTSWSYRRDKLDKSQWITIEQPKVWPFSWPFVIHGKNLPKPNSIHGASDLEDAEINDAINLVSSNLNRIVRIFAHPVVWGYGFGANSLTIDSSKVITSTSDKANLQALELARDLGSAQEFLKFLRTMLSEVSTVPESDPERLKIGATSGFALEVLFNDLLLKTGIKRNFYGKALIELNRRLLELSGFGDANITKLQWPNPLPVDKVSETTADQFDLMSQLVSKKTLSTKRGYDYEQEKDYMKEEQANTATLGENILTAFRNGQS